MICKQCKNNKVTKFTILGICCACNAKNYRNKHPEKYNYKYGGNKHKALKRDNYRCVICESTKRLGIHHIDGNGQSKDGKVLNAEEQNNSLNNLMTLCSKCHSKIDSYKRKKKGWSVKYKECINCSKTIYSHTGKGLCRKCYNIKYASNNNRSEYKKKWYQERGKLLETLRKQKNNLT